MNQVNIPPEVLRYVMRRRGRAHAFESLEPGSTALIVVDMQNYFMAEGEMAYCPHARDIVPNVNRLAAALRKAGGLVVWIQNLASAEAMQDWSSLEELMLPEKRDLRRQRMTPGSEGFELWSELDLQADDLRLTKARYSAFIEGSSTVERQLRERGIENVVVAGVATNVCCESTARDAMMRGFRTLMVSDATAAGTDIEHNASLVAFMKYFGDVDTTKGIIGKLGAL